MLVCPLCRIALEPNDAVCPRDGQLGQETTWNNVPAVLERRFTLIAPFANGLSGSLYVADEPETGRRGLLKIMAPADRQQTAERQRMRRELLKQATMTAPHLALPFATGEVDDKLWLFREVVEGVPLGVRLRKGGLMTQAEALLIASQLTSALDDLHRAGLLHRDVKPAHVVLSTDAVGAARAVLIDSGVCRPFTNAANSVMFGTPGYVAPEQLAGKLVSFRSDLYAVGCIMYEMLTGQAPFAREDAEGTLAAQLAGDFLALPASLSPQVAALIGSLLAKDPQDRPFSAQKLRRALDPFLPPGATVSKHPNASLAKPPVIPDAARTPSVRPTLPPLQSARATLSPAGTQPAATENDRGAADGTHQVQIDQIMSIESSSRPRTVPPPSPRSVPPSANSQAAPSSNRPSTIPKAPEKDPTLVDPSEEAALAQNQTMPIRLEQILAVVNQQKRLSVPRPHEAAPAKAEPSAVGRPARASLWNEPSRSPKGDVASAADSTEPGTLPFGSQPAVPQQPATSDSLQVASQPSKSNAANVHPTLQGFPLQSPYLQDGQLPHSSDAMSMPAQTAQGHPPEDACDDIEIGQYTLWWHPLAALSRAIRACTARTPSILLTADTQRKFAYASAAVVVLGIVSIIMAKLLGEDPKAVAGHENKQPPAAELASANQTAKIARPRTAAPAAEPVAWIVQGAQAEARPAAPTQVAPESATPEPAPAPARTEPEQTRPEPEQARAQRSSKPSVSSDELWVNAREEARAHWAAKRYAQAARAYEKATRYNPTNAATFSGLGGARLQAGDTRGAVRAYQKAVQLSPSTSGFHAALGRAYLTSGDKTKARASYKRALALDPKNAAAKSALAKL